jgi:hypothetical protein
MQLHLHLFHLLFGEIVGLIIIYKKEIINPKKTEICPHDIIVTRTLTAQCGCETTATFCTECGEQLTKPKTDC